MMEESFRKVYNRFKLQFYRHIFSTAGGKDGELSVMEALAGEVIYALGSPTIGQFADAVGLSGPNATYRLRALENKGYVERIPSESDRREYRLRVTDKFVKNYTINEEYIGVVIGRVRQHFSTEDAGKLNELLEAIASELMPEATLEKGEDRK